MEKFCKLMDNKWFALIFGILSFVVAYVGQSVIPFAIAVGIIFGIAREVVNNQMCDNPFRTEIVLYNVIGILLPALLIALFL